MTPIEQEIELMEDAAVMRDFLATSYYKTLEKLWGRALESIKDRAMNDPPASFPMHQGKYWGMQELVNLPHQIIEMADHAKRV